MPISRKLWASGSLSCRIGESKRHHLMPNPDSFIQAIRQGRESQNVEYKQSGQWNDLKQKIIQPSLAMANVKDGGTVIIGMAQEGTTFSPVGMPDRDLVTFKADDIMAAINSYADPPIAVDWHIIDFEGKTLGVLVVHEFDQFPVLCRRDAKGLDEGAFYFRSLRMPETAKVKSHFEMRDILDRAIDRGVKVFLQRAHRVGLLGNVEKFTNPDEEI